jgi:hypothetical protein
LRGKAADFDNGAACELGAILEFAKERDEAASEGDAERL